MCTEPIQYCICVTHFHILDSWVEHSTISTFSKFYFFNFIPASECWACSCVQCQTNFSCNSNCNNVSASGSDEWNEFLFFEKCMELLASSGSEKCLVLVCVSSQHFAYIWCGMWCNCSALVELKRQLGVTNSQYTMSTDVVVVVFIFSVDGVVGLASASSNFQVYNEWHRRTLLPSSLAERKPFRALSLATSKRLCAHVNRRMNECFQCTQRTQKELRIDSGVVSRGCVVVGGDGGETKNYVPKWRMCGERLRQTWRMEKFALELHARIKR